MFVNVLRYKEGPHGAQTQPVWAISDERKEVEVRDSQFVALESRIDFVGPSGEPIHAMQPALSFEVLRGENVVVYPLVIKKPSQFPELLQTNLKACVWLIVSDESFQVQVEKMVVNENFGTYRPQFRSHLKESHRFSEFVAGQSAGNDSEMPSNNIYLIKPFLIDC